MSIIFITHKLNEVLEIADRISVLRRGKKIDTVPREGATEAGLAQLMVGREVVFRVEKPAPTPGRAAARGRRPARLRRPRHREGPRRLVRRSRRRDRRHRRRRQQRPDRADRRAHGPPPRGVRDDRDRRQAVRPRDPEGDDRRGRARAHPRGPPRSRPDPRLLAGREPRAARLPARARLEARLALPAPAHEPRRAPAAGVRRARRRPLDAALARSRAGTSRRSCSHARSTATRRC